jgi:hypothetical protein
MVVTGFSTPATAADLIIEQGVVYAFEAASLTKHG